LQNKRLELFSPPSRLFRGRAAIFFFGGKLWIKDLLPVQSFAREILYATWGQIMVICPAL